MASPKGNEWLCSVPEPTGKRSSGRTVKVIISPSSEMAGTGLVGVRDGRVRGQAMPPKPCPLDVSHPFRLGGWRASALLIVTHSKHFDNCHSHRLCKSAPAVTSMEKKRIARACAPGSPLSTLFLPAPHPSSASCFGLKWDAFGMQGETLPTQIQRKNSASPQ